MPAEEIFSGVLFSDSGDYWLQLPDGQKAKVDFFVRQDKNLGQLVESQGLNQHQQVSILGSHGADSRITGPCILAQNIVSHKDIEQRATEISKSTAGAPLDNWLHAERELLES
jgi:hypothetical protein